MWPSSCPPPTPLPGAARPPRGWGGEGSGSPRRGWCRPGIPAKRHRTSARGYHGRCPSLPRWGRVRGRPSRRSDPRDGRPSSRHPWGCRSWWWWEGGVCGGGLGWVGGFGGGDGLHRPCGGGGGGEGLGLLGRGIAPSSLASDDSKENFRFSGASWGGLGFAWGGGGVWGGGGGHPPPPPASPSLTPPPPMLPHISSSSPPPAYPTSCIRAHSLGRKWRGATHTPLTTRAVSQSRRPRKRARPGGGSRATMRWTAPKGTSWEPSASGQATQMGVAFVALTTTSMTYKKMNKKSVN